MGRRERRGAPLLAAAALTAGLLPTPMTRAANIDRKANHLAGEKSPYLLQHAYNPVDWYPWGETAFAKARAEGKPIFLSIGYSTCHWCHVMEKESFSDPKTAAYLNENFVAIKVDREERPDVDRIYMTAVQALTGSGGWPLSAFLTPELTPFFGGTYFPPEPRWGSPGFPQVLEKLAGLWKSDRAKLVTSGRQLAQFVVDASTAGSPGGRPDPASLDKGFAALRDHFDADHGGFAEAPKFPMPVNQNFLLRYYSRTKKKEALDMAVFTLDKMARGGVYDQVGGGFHRYSTDERWHVPHFEKMLYDNAQLAVNYIEAWQLTGDEHLSRAAKETLDYVLRDMTDPKGGFYSAEDADSLPAELAGKVPDEGHQNRKEGAFYVWGKKELTKVLGKQPGEAFCFRYGVEEDGNAQHDPHGEFAGKNILYIAHTMKETAAHIGKGEGETRDILERARKKLLEIRAKRPRPSRDDKILAAWNGLMISALAKAGRAFDDPDYLKAAEKAAAFARANLYDPKAKRLYRRWRDGEKKGGGMAEDYAFLAQGLIDLYEASFDVRWLQWAVELTDAQQNLFFDAEKGGYFMTAADQDPSLLARVKEETDNVEPAASSVAAMNLLRLSQFTDRRDYRAAAEKTLSLFAKTMLEAPRAVPQMLAALQFSLAKAQQVVVAGAPDAPDTIEMLRRVNRRFLPDSILMLADGGEGQAALAKGLPFIAHVKPLKGKATAYVCINYACDLPTSDLSELEQILDGRPPLP